MSKKANLSSQQTDIIISSDDLENDVNEETKINNADIVKPSFPALTAHEASVLWVDLFRL